MTKLPSKVSAMTGIYAIVFDNGKMYIGQTIDFEHRWWSHEHAARSGDSTLVYRAMRKHPYTYKVLCNCATEHLYDLEKELIAEFGTSNRSNGYNLTCGGDGVLGLQHTPESRAKMSKSHAGKILKAETKARMSEAQLLRYANNPELRERVSQVHSGRKHSPEEIKNRADANRGKVRSAESRAKMSAVPRAGHKKPRSPEHCAKISERMKLQNARLKAAKQPGLPIG